ncbi:MAG: hypothetical protein N2712_00750 [Brevinematales bacterium]|nr:hypothetical protein [Brevinematales bacterium]
MDNFLNIVIALLIVVGSVWAVFRFINFLAVLLRARVVKNKKIQLPPKYQRLLSDKRILVLYFSSPLSEKGRNKMTNVMKLVDEEYGNVVRFNLVNDKKEAEKFNVISAPTIVIIDSEGIVREYKTGFIPFPKVKGMIEKYIKK